MRSRDIDDIRAEINGVLNSDSKLTANVVAREIGVSKGTLSKYRSGIYPGNNAMIAERLASWLGSRKIAQEQLAGNLKQMWIVRLNRDRIKLIRTRKALDRALEASPEAAVITMWLGMDTLHDVFFSSGGLHND